MSSTVKGKTINISGPSILGFMKAMNPLNGTFWELKFKCGNCGAKPVVQHDEDKDYHKCPACKTINILDVTSYWELV